MKKINTFLRNMTYSSKYELLEEGKNDSELKEIAEKRGIVLPAKDLSVFKCRYAYVDKTNLNGCDLPKAEVESSIQTLVGKAIDFDHIRKKIVGFWIDAKLEGDEIIAYGIFFKGNLDEDYEVIQSLLKENKLRVSFEAYGKREFKEDSTYSLNDIEFAGGALLIDTMPAFPGADVLEMSNKKNRVLELASVLKEPETYLKKKEDAYIEKARMYTEDMNTILRVVGEVECPTCKEKFVIGLDSIDFVNNKATGTCWLCGAKCNMELTPKTTLTQEGRKISQVSIEKETEYDEDNEEGKNNKGEEKMENKEEAVVENSSEQLEKLSEEDVIDTPQEDLKKDEEETASEKAETEEVKAEEATQEVKTEEVTKPEETQETAEVTALKTEIESLKVQLQKKDEEIAQKVEEAKVLTAKVIERKSALGSFSKDVSDSDLLDDVKFEILRLKKENAELKSAKIEVSSLEIGGENEEKEEVKDKEEIDRGFSLGKKVRDLAFPQK